MMPLPTTPVLPRDRRRSAVSRRARAFTLVELLAVIGIIALLVGILVPTISGIVRSGRDSAQRQALNSLARALDAYRGDHNDIPRFSDDGGNFNRADVTPDRGARLLARALFAPAPKTDSAVTPAGWQGDSTAQRAARADAFQDGFEGPGFKSQRQVVPNGSSGLTFYLPGETYGPYLPPDRWNLQTFNGDVTPEAVILDANGLPILYYPARRTTPPLGDAAADGGSYASPITSNGNGIAAANPPALYNEADNAMFMASEAVATSAANLPTGYSAADAAELTFFRQLIGDTNANGIIDDAEKPIVKPYLLIASGANAADRGALNAPTDNMAAGFATDYANFLKAAGWEIARSPITSFDAERE